MIESTAIYCFVVSMILLFANRSGATSSPGRARRQGSNPCSSIGSRSVRRRSTSSSWCGDEAVSLQAHPPRHRRPGEANRHGTRRRRREKGRSQEGARRVPTQERGVRPAARRTHEQGNRRGERRTPAAPRGSAAGSRCPECQATGRAEDDAHRLNQAIRRRTQQEVFAIVRRR